MGVNRRRRWMAVSSMAYVDGVEEVGFQSSFEGVQGARIADGSRYIVPGSRCRDYKGVSVEVRRRMRQV